MDETIYVIYKLLFDIVLEVWFSIYVIFKVQLDFALEVWFSICLNFCFFFQHMLKHRYVPWSHGKTVYKGKEDTGKVVSS